jgi:RNA 3'-terminal phosphate cyclase (ATP)
MTEPITINGSEGGGQMLRNAVALSAVTGRPVRVVNIRGARPQPGLRPQHLLAVRATAEACGGRLLGAEIGSREIVFEPGEVAPRQGWRLEVGTAGSVMLILQSLLPALAAANGPSELTLTGGTDVPFAPPYDHFDQVFLPALSELGPQVTMQLVRRGFYPKGGGQMRVIVGQERVSCPVRSFAWTKRGAAVGIRGRSYSQGLPSHIAERMRSAALNVLSGSGQEPAVELEMLESGPGEGCGIVLWAECEGGRRFAGSALGRRGKRAEEVGREAARALLSELAGDWAVETHLADQLIVWMALADGPSEFTTAKLTDHVRNAVIVAEAVAGARFALEEGRPARVKCEV